MDITPQEIVDKVCAELDHILVKPSWGETALFYNPEHTLPNGVYFCTIKEKDGANDKASELSRDGVFRLSIGLPTATYEMLFGSKPQRPTKGKTVALTHDFTECDALMPHPIYAWMGWAQVLSPTYATFTQIMPLIAQAHTHAALKFQAKTKKSP